MADENLLSGDADLADLLHQETDHALASPGLAPDGDFALLIADADPPEAQMPGNEAYQPADPARFDQVVVGGQGKAGMNAFRRGVQLLFDLLKAFALQDQVPGPPDQHGLFRSGGLGIDHGNLLVRFLFQNHVSPGAGAVVAAGQGAGDRKGDHRPRNGEFFPPGFRGRTGGLGHFGMAFVCLQHFIHRHVFIVNVFFSADTDGEGNGGKIHFAFSALQCEQVACRIGNQMPDHGFSAPFSPK